MLQELEKHVYSKFGWFQQKNGLSSLYTPDVDEGYCKILKKFYLVGIIFSWISQTFIAINFVFLPKNFHFLSRFSHGKILFSKILFFYFYIFKYFKIKAWHKIGLLAKWNNGEPDTRYNNNGSQVQERFVKSASELSLYINLRKSYFVPCTKIYKNGLGRLSNEVLQDCSCN